MAEDGSDVALAANETCFCGAAPAVYTSRKPGANLGRKYHACATRVCRYFRAADGKPWNRDEPPLHPAPQPILPQQPAQPPPRPRKRSRADYDASAPAPPGSTRGFISAARLLRTQNRKNYRAVSKAVHEATSVVEQLAAVLDTIARMCPCMSADSSESEGETDGSTEITPLRPDVLAHLTGTPAKRPRGPLTP